MREGAILRNLVLGGVYFLAFPLILVFLPVIGAVLVWRNHARLAESLSGVPGISPGGGPRSGVAAGAYAVVFLGLLFAAVLASDDPGEPAPHATDEISDAEPDQSTPAAERSDDDPAGDVSVTETPSSDRETP